MKKSPNWYEKEDEMLDSLTSLEGLAELIKARKKANLNPHTRIESFIIFGRYLLRGHYLNLLMPPPYEKLPLIPIIFPERKYREIGPILTESEIPIPVIPGSRETCPQCGSGWNLFNLADTKADVSNKEILFHKDCFRARKTHETAEIIRVLFCEAGFRGGGVEIELKERRSFPHDRTLLRFHVYTDSGVLDVTCDNIGKIIFNGKICGCRISKAVDYDPNPAWIIELDFDFKEQLTGADRFRQRDNIVKILSNVKLMMERGRG